MPLTGFRAVQGGLFFVVGSTLPGATARLWRTDGTVAGTHSVDPELELSFWGTLFQAAALGASLVFLQVEPGSPTILWTSDGTAAGTGPILGLSPGVEGEFVHDLTAFDGAVYYLASRADVGSELFRTDGTAAGTGLFADIEPGPAGSSPGNLTPARDRLLFKVVVPSSEIWVTDGTAGGLQPLSELEPALAGVELGPFLAPLRPAGDRVAFLDYQMKAGFWLTDGEPGGTHFIDAPAVVDFEPDFSFPGPPLVPSDDGDGLFFSASDDSEGSELWWWRGPGFDAQRVIELAPGLEGSEVTVLGELGGGLLVAGGGIESGAELYRIELGDLGLFGAEPVGSPCGLDSAARIGFAGEVVVGATFELLVTGAAPLQTALDFYDGGISVLPLGSGCAAYVLTPKLVATTATGADGAAAVDVALPDDPALVGALVTAQWVVAEPGGPLGGALALSDALELVFGS